MYWITEEKILFLFKKLFAYSPCLNTTEKFIPGTKKYFPFKIMTYLNTKFLFLEWMMCLS